MVRDGTRPSKERPIWDATKGEASMTLEKMYELDKRATEALFNKIKSIKGLDIKLRECSDGFTFRYKGHTYIFTAELED